MTNKKLWSAPFISLLFFSSNIFAQVKAFPTAEGYGRFTVGGRGGAVFIVNSLADSGPGTLRECMESTGPRTCVFAVSGNIDLMGIPTFLWEAERSELRVA